MTMVAVAIGGSAVIGAGSAYMQGQEASKSARLDREQAAATSAQTTALNAPYMYAGNAALNPLMALYGINAGLPTSAGGASGGGGASTPEQQKAARDMFYQSPEYTIQKQALDQALGRSASAQGTMYSPSTAMGSAEIAGRTFGDWRNNLAGLAQMGPAGANNQASNLQNLSSGLISANNAAGAARGNMYGAIGQTAQDSLGQYSQYKQYQDRTSQLSQLMNPAPAQDWSSLQIPNYTAPQAIKF